MALIPQIQRLSGVCLLTGVEAGRLKVFTSAHQFVIRKSPSPPIDTSHRLRHFTILFIEYSRLSVAASECLNSLETILKTLNSSTRTDPLQRFQTRRTLRTPDVHGCKSFGSDSLHPSRSSKHAPCRVRRRLGHQCAANEPGGTKEHYCSPDAICLGMGLVSLVFGQPQPDGEGQPAVERRRRRTRWSSGRVTRSLRGPSDCSDL